MNSLTRVKEWFKIMLLVTSFKIETKDRILLCLKSDKEKLKKKLF